MKLVSIVGTRPNFVKLAALDRSIQSMPNWKHIIIHTGQHSSKEMSSQFFDQLQLQKPHFQFTYPTGNWNQQLSVLLQKLDTAYATIQPDIVLVYGDVTSTLAGALAARNCQIPIAHIEAGLRSFDRTMPEEQNRLMVASLADYHFVSEESAVKNLEQEGISKDRIYWVGNVIIDVLFEALDGRKSPYLSDEYVLFTLHRPSNVDTLPALLRTIELLAVCTQEYKVWWPLHPRTKKQLEAFGLNEQLYQMKNLTTIPPADYFTFVHLMRHAAAVVTDSGGVQEETTALGVPCLTFRTTTERPVTVSLGTNYLINDLRPSEALTILRQIRNGTAKKGVLPPYWDGQASERIVSILQKVYSNS